MSTTGAGAITLDQLVALNQEMGALIRAGVPLDRGLRELGGDLSGGLSGLSQRLAERLSSGQPLATVLSAEGDRLPPLYRAVVEAGVRSGNLASALEGLAQYAIEYSRTRRSIGLALFYPLIIVIISYTFFVGFVVYLTPRYLAVFESMRLEAKLPIRILEALRETLPYWVGILPVLILVFLFWWVASSRSSSLQPGRFGGLPRRVPGFRRMLADAHTANLSEILALLVEHQVPLDSAMLLAAEASGDPEASRDAEVFSKDILEGRTLTVERLRSRGGFPPLLVWMLASGLRQATLVDSLRNAAATYRRRSTRRAEQIRRFAPAACIIVIGGGVMAMYTWMLMTPLVSLWDELSKNPR